MIHKNEIHTLSVMHSLLEVEINYYCLLQKWVLDYTGIRKVEVCDNSSVTISQIKPLLPHKWIINYI